MVWYGSRTCECDELTCVCGVVSGGFATVQPGNLLSINAVEAYSLDDFSGEAVRAGLADAQKVASGGGSEEEVAEARIEVEVYEALQVLPPPL